MELRHLRAFIVVAEELNFRRAAERLHMAQPPLSQQIKRLEHEVGVTLLRRTTRQVTLTPAGQAFLDEARRCVEAAQAAVRTARLAAGGDTGVLRLGVSGPTFYEVLVLMAGKFGRHRPNVRLEITGPAFAGELIERLDRDEIDACLIRLPVPGSGIVVRKITEHPFGAVLPVGHPLAHRDRVRLAELRGEPVISYPSKRASGTVTLLHSAFLAQGFSPNIVQEAPDTHTIMLLAAVGAGIGFVPMSASHLKVPGVVLVPVSDMPALPLALAWREGDDNPVLHALISLLDEVSAECHRWPGAESAEAGT
ncbi:LysR substrate-binding domain-containing protein [Actinomadura rugatobispora]|uniref:LysR substrate-binding domain-containing protein n=1 Tax=Actinomadura rugatobispora TaxID=1994 RepID=A0ABW1A617_9ACTN|nr:LysR family transcriptional regulator [Actinomadura rugatobispora]